MDIAFGIPPLLAQWRSGKVSRPGAEEEGRYKETGNLRIGGTAMGEPALQSLMSVEKIADLLGKLLQVHEELRVWREDFWRLGQESSWIDLQPTTWENERFDTQEVSAGKLFPTSYTFSHFPIAMASVYFDGIQIQLLKNIAEICSVLGIRLDDTQGIYRANAQRSFSEAVGLLHGESLSTSITRVLRCSEYFLDSDKKLLGPTTYMYAFHTSFNALCRLKEMSSASNIRRQIRWCRLVSEKYEEARLASLTSNDVGTLITSFSRRLASDNLER